MSQRQRQRPQSKKPRKQRRFAKVDVAYFTEEDDCENPDWLIGAY